MKEDKGVTPIGFCNFRNQRTKFGIKVDDRRRHIYIVGKTGVGKSTLLENMAIEDILAGRGVGIVDPHGEFAEKMLDFVPEERLDDVIYFNPGDFENPIAFNPLEQAGTQFRHLIASGLMGIFKKIWPDVWSARMEYILNNTLLALLEFPDSTVLGIMRMLSEPTYRKQIVDNLKDPVVKAFWSIEFARYSQRLETEAVAAIQNKVGQFVSNPLIRNILGQPRSTVNMRDVMDGKKILIVNLSKGKIGEDNSALLGAMIITRLQLAAMSRVDIPESKRKDFFLYVDEFQNFATESFASILSEARKYHLSLTLAHQYIGQLVHDKNTKVRDSVFGNVGTIVSFRVGAADAEFLEKEFLPEFTENDLVNLPKAGIYVKLMIDGVASAPFSAETVPPRVSEFQSNREVIIKNSKERYGVPRAVIEAKIQKEWESGESEIMNKAQRRDERSLSDVLSPRERSERPFRPQYPRPTAPREEYRPPHQEYRPPRRDESRPGPQHEDTRPRPTHEEMRPRPPREENRPARENMPPRPEFKPRAPYEKPKPHVDVDALRKAIGESLEENETSKEENTENKV